MKTLEFLNFRNPFTISLPLNNTFNINDNVYLIKQIINKINGFDLGNKYKIDIIFDEKESQKYILKLTTKENDIIYKQLNYNNSYTKNEIGYDNYINFDEVINRGINNIFREFINIILEKISNIYSFIDDNKKIINEKININQYLKKKLELYTNYDTIEKNASIYKKRKFNQMFDLFNSIEINDFPNKLEYENDNKFNYTKYLTYKIRFSDISYEQIQTYFNITNIQNYFKKQIIIDDNLSLEYLKIITIIKALTSSGNFNIKNVNLKLALVTIIYEQIVIKPKLEEKVFDLINSINLIDPKYYNTLEFFELRKLLASLYINGINEIISKTIVNLFDYYYLCYHENYQLENNNEDTINKIKKEQLENYNKNIEQIKTDWRQTNGFLTKEFNLTGNSFILKFIGSNIDLPYNFIYHLVYKFNIRNSNELISLINSPLIIDIIINYNHIEELNESNKNIYFTKFNFDLLIKLFVSEIMNNNENISDYFDFNNETTNELILFKPKTIFLKSTILSIVLLYINESIIYNFNNENEIINYDDYDITNIYLNIINNQNSIYNIIKKEIDNYYSFILKLFNNNKEKIYNKVSNVIKIKKNIALFVVVYMLLHYETRSIDKNMTLFIESLLTIINPLFKTENNFKNIQDIYKIYDPKFEIIKEGSERFKKYHNQYIRLNIEKRHNIEINEYILLINCIEWCFKTNHNEILLFLFNGNTYEIELNDKKYYKNEVLNNDKNEVLNNLFNEEYLKNFYDNIEINNNITINSNFIYSIQNSNLILPLFSNTLISEHKNEKNNEFDNMLYGRMFFDIEDIHNDNEHFYNDIIIYINMLIDDLCEVAKIENEKEKELMKQKCFNEFIITTNTSSAHGISYHVYLPLICQYAQLKVFLKKRKEEFNSSVINKNLHIECVYSYIDPLVYNNTLTSIRLPFYGKGNLKLDYYDFDKELSSNNNIKELIEFKEWLELIKNFEFDYLIKNLESLNLSDKQNIQNILGINNIEDFIISINENINNMNSNLLKDLNNYNLNVLYKKRNLILLFMMQYLITKPDLNTRILQKPFNMHLLYKVGNGLLEKINQEIIKENIKEEDKKTYCLKQIIERTLITNIDDCLKWDYEYEQDYKNNEWNNFINSEIQDDKILYFKKISEETMRMTNCEIKNERIFNNNDFEYCI